MKIKVDQIPAEGMSVELEKDFAWLKQHQAHSLLEEASFERPLASNVFLQRQGRDVLVRGRLSLPIRATCVRCLEPFPFTLSNDFDLLLMPRREMLELEDERPSRRRRGRSDRDVGNEPRKPARKKETVETELTAEDIGTDVYFSGMIDLDRLIDEHMNLAVPMRFICREDCKGLCARCGGNLNLTPGCACKPREVAGLRR